MEKEEEARFTECLKYFKERSVYQKVFQKARERYESLGHLGGRICLSELAPEETDQLSGFLKKDFSGQKNIAISWTAMEKALAESRFAGLSFQKLLEAYFGEPFQAKKERRMQAASEKEGWLKAFLKLPLSKPQREWLERLWKEKGKDYQYLTGLYMKAAKEAEEIMRWVLKAGRKLPSLRSETESLAVFAARVTGNPHAFDAGTKGLHVLVMYLRHLFGRGNILPESEELEETKSSSDSGIQGEKCRSLSECQEENSRGLSGYLENLSEWIPADVWDLLELAGILRDALSNHVLVYRLHGERKEGGLHQGLEGFCKEQQAFCLTLETIRTLACVWGEKKQIYMVENPAVFEYLIRRYPKESFLCGNGQPKAAVYRLIEAVDDGTDIYYAGDYDPEGLLIAERLKCFAPQKIKFWHYETTLYHKGRSKERISETRQKQMQGLKSPKLLAIAEQIRENGYAAYQEAVMEEYCIMDF